MIKQLHQAKAAIAKKDYEKKYNSLSIVIDVLYTLRSGFGDEDATPEMKEIDKFYITTIRILEKNNIKEGDNAEIDLVINSLNVMRQEIAKQEGASSELR